MSTPGCAAVIGDIEHDPRFALDAVIFPDNVNLAVGTECRDRIY